MHITQHQTTFEQQHSDHRGLTIELLRRVGISEEEWDTMVRCRYHCCKCDRHFDSERAWRTHYEFPGRMEGCQRPDLPWTWGPCALIELNSQRDIFNDRRVYWCPM